ncbi:MAG: hypothetical protein JXA71_03860 [Chitinispirillaceae bacterium]|nr:hypothetical protein [Chitinispirillaceae bacterium]
MKIRILFPILLSGLVSLAAAGDAPKPTSDEITVETKGMGRNSTEAMLSAKRAAVEKGIGTVIQSETEIKNFMVNKDVILTRTVGAVKSVTTLSETKGPDGAITLKIKAVVSKQKINNDLMALRILLESMEKPRVMVLMKESNMQDSAASGNLAETEIINYLTKKGFSLVDQAATEQLRKQEQARSALDGNAAAAAAIGAQAGAEMIVTGNAVSRVAEEISKNLGGMKSCQADVSLKVILCANAAIVAAKTEHAAVAHVNPVSGGAKAIAEATRKALDRHLLEKIVASWQDQINNGMSLRVTVSDVKSFKTSKAVIDGLPALSSSVVKVTKRDWNQSTGILELDVLYKGNSDGFCETVDGGKLSDGTTVAVTGSAAGSARLKVTGEGGK